MNRGYRFYAFRFLSRRNLDRGSRRVRAAIIAIALSLVPFVTVVEVSGGMIAGITSHYLEIGSFHLQVRLFGDIGDEAIDMLVETLRDEPYVVDAFLIYEGVGLIYGQDARVGVTIRSYPEYIVADPDTFGRFVEVEGRFESDGVAVSEGVMSELGVDIGDSVGIVVARTLPNGRFVLKRADAQITATYTTGYADLDGHSIILPQSHAETLFPRSDNRFVGIKIVDPFGDVDIIARKLQSTMPSGAYVYSWRELERGMYTTFQTTRSLLIIIMAVIVSVAAITISSSLIILVTEREIEIALLRSLGATSRKIQRTFLILGAVAGAIGSTVGVSMGLFVSLKVNELFRIIERCIEYVLRIFTRVVAHDPIDSVRILDPAFYLERIPVEPKATELFAIVAASIVLATLSAWLPARRAGRINPSSVLSRH